MKKKVKKKNTKSKQLYKKSKQKNKDQKEIKLFIGIPARGSVSMYWTLSLIGLMRKLGWGTQMMSTDEIPLTRARNRIVREFMDSKCTHLLWIDADTLPPPNGAHRLIQSLKHYKGDPEENRFDIMSGLYFSRKKEGNYKPVAFLKFDSETKRHNYIFMWAKKPFIVDAVGMGFCIIPRYVFETLELPYYLWNSDPSEGYWKENEGSFSYGEDMYFCEKARGAGFTIGVDPGVTCGHTGENIIGAKDYLDQIRLGKLGTSQLFNILETGDKLLNSEQKSIITDLCNYTGKPMNEVVDLLTRGKDLVKQKWLESNPVTPQEVYDFYRNCEEYIYDLSTWNYFTSQQIDSLDTIARQSRGRILDYGAGIGAYLIKCWELGNHDLTHYDVPGPVLDFARWRYKQRGMDIEIVEAPIDIVTSDPLHGVYDTVAMLDVLEHVPDPMAHLGLIRKHIDLGNPDTLFHVNMPEKTKDHPMHFTHTLSLHEMLNTVFRENVTIKNKHTEQGDIII